MEINKLIDSIETGKRADLFLCESFPEISRRIVQESIKAGNLKVDGRPLKSGYKLKDGDLLTGLLNVEKEHGYDIKPEKIKLDIIFEDDSIIVVNKQSGLTVHPGAGRRDGTLVNGLVYHFKDKLSDVGGVGRPGIVHRLDKDTSGILLVAKNNETHSYFSDLFKNRKIKKEYHAIVWGEVSGDGEIDRPLGRCLVNRQKMRIATGGRESFTAYKVKQSNGYFSELIIKPGSGRTHQIRVHLSSIGHPILGDSLYGGGKARIKQIPPLYKSSAKTLFNKINRFMLHAEKLSFYYPAQKKSVRFSAKLPLDIKDVISAL